MPRINSRPPRTHGCASILHPNNQGKNHKQDNNADRPRNSLTHQQQASFGPLPYKLANETIAVENHQWSAISSFSSQELPLEKSYRSSSLTLYAPQPDTASTLRPYLAAINDGLPSSRTCQRYHNTSAALKQSASKSTFYEDPRQASEDQTLCRSARHGGAHLRQKPDTETNGSPDRHSLELRPKSSSADEIKPLLRLGRESRQAFRVADTRTLRRRSIPPPIKPPSFPTRPVITAIRSASQRTQAIFRPASNEKLQNDDFTTQRAEDLFKFEPFPDHFTHSLNQPILPPESPLAAASPESLDLPDPYGRYITPLEIDPSYQGPLDVTQSSKSGVSSVSYPTIASQPDPDLLSELNDLQSPNDVRTACESIVKADPYWLAVLHECEEEGVENAMHDAYYLVYLRFHEAARRSPNSESERYSTHRAEKMWTWMQGEGGMPDEEELERSYREGRRDSAMRKLEGW